LHLAGHLLIYIQKYLHSAHVTMKHDATCAKRYKVDQNNALCFPKLNFRVVSQVGKSGSKFP